jgi:hypothetical protein
MKSKPGASRPPLENRVTGRVTGKEPAKNRQASGREAVGNRARNRLVSGSKAARFRRVCGSPTGNRPAIIRQADRRQTGVIPARFQRRFSAKGEAALSGEDARLQSLRGRAIDILAAELDGAGDGRLLAACAILALTRTPVSNARRRPVADDEADAPGAPPLSDAQVKDVLREIDDRRDGSNRDG